MIEGLKYLRKGKELEYFLEHTSHQVIWMTAIVFDAKKKCAAGSTHYKIGSYVTIFPGYVANKF